MLLIFAVHTCIKEHIPTLRQRTPDSAMYAAMAGAGEGTIEPAKCVIGPPAPKYFSLVARGTMLLLLGVVGHWVQVCPTRVAPRRKLLVYARRAFLPTFVCLLYVEKYTQHQCLSKHFNTCNTYAAQVVLGGVALGPTSIKDKPDENSTTKLFNWHPILMTLAFGVFMAEALLAYRAPLLPWIDRSVRGEGLWGGQLVDPERWSNCQLG